MRPRFLLATLAGLVLGAIIHLTIILAIPHFAAQDAYSRLQAVAEKGKHGFIDPTGNANNLDWLRYRDPAITTTACPYDLTTGPYIVMVQSDVPFESVAFHAQRGNVFFSVTDQAQVRGQTSFLVATEIQMAMLLQSGEYDEYYSGLVKVASTDRRGIVTIRTLAPSSSYRKLSEDTIAQAECRPLTIEDRAQDPETDRDSIPQDLRPPRRGR